MPRRVRSRWTVTPHTSQHRRQHSQRLLGSPEVPASDGGARTGGVVEMRVQAPPRTGSRSSRLQR